MNVVWFKRDLRVNDHRPLYEAARGKDCLPIYIIEPNYWQQPDTSDRQWRFIADSLLELDQALAALGQGLWVLEGEAVEVLAWLHQQWGIETLYSHEETGNAWTFQRDIAVKHWAANSQISWREYPQFGVKRRMQSRDDWTQHWQAVMLADIAPPPQAIQCSVAGGQSRMPLDKLHALRGFDQSLCHAQQGGWRVGQKIVNEFLGQRGQFYRGGISKPSKATQYCSRLSPYITYGCISLRHLVQSTHAAQLDRKDQSRWRSSLNAFESRLHWHCHFMQKLEDEPEIEQRCMHPSFEGLRERPMTVQQQAYFTAWQQGQTGYPLVDACMRMLNATGWLNFRMRAMLVSFASYHLWLDWRDTALHLARMFVDYEPGIHYSQMQMQSGTTGINPPRIYNPVKQSQDQDPDGVFIRQWCSELRGVPVELVHQPWLLNCWEEKDYGLVLGQDYPKPIVDMQEAGKQARQRYGEWKNRYQDKLLTAAVINRHASRKKRKAKKPSVDFSQLDLFDKPK